MLPTVTFMHSEDTFILENTALIGLWPHLLTWFNFNLNVDK